MDTLPPLAALRVFDAELALERLSVSVRRVVRPPEGDEGDQRPDALALTALRVGLGHLRDALASRTGHEAVLEAAEDARAAVAGLVLVAVALAVVLLPRGDAESPGRGVPPGGSRRRE